MFTIKVALKTISKAVARTTIERRSGLERNFAFVKKKITPVQIAPSMYIFELRRICSAANIPRPAYIF